MRRLQIRERTQGKKKSRLVEIGLSLDTRRAGKLADRVVIEYGERRIELPVTAAVRPRKEGTTKVLVVMPGFGDRRNGRDYYRPWFDLIESAALDVGYLDPSIEGFPDEVTQVDPRGLPVLPAWLKGYDVILLADGGPLYLRGFTTKVLESFVRGGGRLVVNASGLMAGTVPPANEILAPFGLELAGQDVLRGRAADKRGWAPIIVDGKTIDPEGRSRRSGPVVTRRYTPVRVAGGTPAEILLADAQEKRADHGIAAVARDGGEVIAFGESLPFSWLGDSEEGTENARFLQGLLTKPRDR